MFPLYDLNPTGRVPVVTRLLILVNLLALVWLMRQNEAQQTVSVLRYGFIPARLSQLWDPRVLQFEIPVQDAQVRLLPEWLQPRRAVEFAPHKISILMSLLTAMFLHGGWLHLGSNMWFLWIFGDNIEDRLGRTKFLLFYLLGGVLATLCQWAIAPQSTVPVIGASGAVAAVLGAYALKFPMVSVRCLIFIVLFITTIDVPAVIVLGIWFIQQALDAFGALRVNGMQAANPVAFMAHVGGFVAGLVIGLWIPGPSPPPEPPDDATHWGLDPAPWHRSSQ